MIDSLKIRKNSFFTKDRVSTHNAIVSRMYDSKVTTAAANMGRRANTTGACSPVSCSKPGKLLKRLLRQEIGKRTVIS